MFPKRISVTIVLLAAVPTALYSWLLWRLDRYEREPLHLLAVSFVWGALPALLFAAVVELGLGDLLGGRVAANLDSALIAPFVEEPIKALALIGLFLFVRREFNDVLDGIVYGALVGFGFAMSENMLYFLSNPDQLVAVWTLRAVVFGFNHAFYTSIVGIVLGLIRLDPRRWLGYAALPAAIALAMLLHAAHNASVQAGLIGLLVAWIVDSGGVLVVLAIAVLSQRNERHWLETQLTPEIAADVIDRRDLMAVFTPSVRFHTLVRALIRKGWLQYRHRRRFYHLLIELAFVKHQLAHGDRFCCQDDVERLRAALIAERALVQEIVEP
jgi:RsiW-degrading membrane proteinase PrsW (M82 family)